MSELEKQIGFTHVGYHVWATGEMLQSASTLGAEALDRDLGTSFGSVRRTMAHMFAVDVLWMARLKNDANVSLSSVAVPPDLKELKGEWLARLEDLLREVHSASDSYLQSTCSFRNSTGAEFECQYGKSFFIW